MDSQRKGILLGILATTTVVAVVCATAFYFGYTQEEEDAGKPVTKTPTDAEETKKNQAQKKEIDMKLVIRLQAFFRGSNARRKLAGQKKKSDNDEKYFLSEERNETLRSVMWDSRATIERRPLYTYKTGAEYEGTW